MSDADYAEEQGPPHADGCTTEAYEWLSGVGYNRVWICECGAETHAPEPGSFTLGILPTPGATLNIVAEGKRDK